MSYQLVLTTCPDAESARRIAGELVAARLAACVSILPGLTSIYEWQGKSESSQELLLLIKTRSEIYPAVEAAIKRSHPYELPEVIAAPITAGLAPYLAWIDQQTDHK